MKYTVIILCFFLCTSCRTIGARSKQKYYGQLYPTTNLDIKGIHSAYSESNGLIPPAAAVAFSVFDIPLSVVTDTLFLPADLIVTASAIDENKDES